MLTDPEFSKTPNQAYFHANFWFLMLKRLLLGILIYGNFFSADVSQPEDYSESPNLASATKEQKIAANPMPQGLS